MKIMMNLTSEKFAKARAMTEARKAADPEAFKNHYNRSRIFSRAWKAYRTRTAKFEAGQIKVAPTFGASLKWSWKIEKEEQLIGGGRKKAPAPFKTWSPKPNFFRFYFGDGQYVQVSTKSKIHYDGDHLVERKWTGFYKTVGVSKETFTAHQAAIASAAGADKLVESRF